MEDLLAVTGMSSAALTEERRSSLRRRVLKRGKALFHDNTTVLDCLVRDISDGGARIIMEHAATLPRAFRLAIVNDVKVREVRVVWRREDQAGLAFLPAAGRSAKTED